MKGLSGIFKPSVRIGNLVALALTLLAIVVFMPASTGRADDEYNTPASLTNEDLNTLESRLREIRSQTLPNYPEEPMLLVKSGWPFESWWARDNPFQLRPCEEEVFPEVEHQAPPDMTTEELMLAFGWVHKNAEDYHRLSAEERLEFNKAHPRTEDRGFWSSEVHPVKEIAKNWLDYYIATGKKAERLVEVAHWRGYDKLILKGSPIVRSDTLDRFTSPVTGKLMRINNRQFSAGNMHIDVFSLSELRNDLVVDVSKFEDICAHQGIAEENTVIAFYRAYGTKGVVKTAWLLRDRNKAYTSALST